MKINQLFLLLIVALFTLAACGGGADQGNPPPESDLSPGGFDGLVEALKAQGAEVEISDPIDQPFFSVSGQALMLKDQNVQVFEYPDADAAAAETETIAPDGGSVGTSMMMWMDDPHFFTQDNLIVLYVGSDSATLELLQAVLGPQIAGR